MKKAKTKKKVVKKKAAKKTLSKDDRELLKIVNLKVSSKDRSGLVKNAKRYAGGNLSAWLRYAGLHFTPAKSETVKLEARR